MAITHKIFGIDFNDIKTSTNIKLPAFAGSKIHGSSTEDLNADYGEGGNLPTIVNAVEIDWNGAQLKNGSTVKATLNTTGEMLSILQTA